MVSTLSCTIASTCTRSTSVACWRTACAYLRGRWLCAASTAAAACRSMAMMTRIDAAEDDRVDRVEAGELGADAAAGRQRADDAVDDRDDERVRRRQPAAGTRRPRYAVATVQQELEPRLAGRSASGSTASERPGHERDEVDATARMPMREPHETAAGSRAATMTARPPKIDRRRRSDPSGSLQLGQLARAATGKVCSAEDQAERRDAATARCVSNARAAERVARLGRAPGSGGRCGRASCAHRPRPGRAPAGCRLRPRGAAGRPSSGAGRPTSTYFTRMRSRYSRAVE